MSLGLFDSDKTVRADSYFNYGTEKIDTTEHQQLAMEAALQSITLLQNRPVAGAAGAAGANTAAAESTTTTTTTTANANVQAAAAAAAALPLKKGLKLAVIGPHSNSTEKLLGNVHVSLCMYM
jgi:beta-glucosidase-like glycosyl hydrolase